MKKKEHSSIDSLKSATEESFPLNREISETLVIYCADPRFRAAFKDFVEQEGAGVSGTDPMGAMDQDQSFIAHPVDHLANGFQDADRIGPGLLRRPPQGG